MTQAMIKKTRAKTRRWTLKRLVDELGAPTILVANTYYWGGFYGNADSRDRRALKYVEEVASWLHHINSKYRLGLEIKVDEDHPDVRAYHDGKEVFYFHISSSRANVYKRQNVRGLLSLLRQHA